MVVPHATGSQGPGSVTSLSSVGPRLRALGRIGDRLGLVDRLVDRSGRSTCGQFDVAATGRCSSPLNSGSSMRLRRRRSPCTQPRFGQIATFGRRHAAELRVHRVACVTSAELQLEADLLDCSATTCASPSAGDGVVADDQQRRRALVLAARVAGLLHVLGRERAVAARASTVKSKPGPFRPPASSKPAMPGGRKCVRDRAERLAAARLAQRVAVEAARSTALRTLTLSNGLPCVFSEM